MLTTLLSLAWNSIYARKTTAILTILAVALSVALFLGVEKTRHSARSSFENTISGVDAIVGGRTGPVNLLLFSVFRIGAPSTPMSWESYEAIANRPDVAWAIPISLGDSHKGYKVLGTTEAYFENYKYAQKTSLSLARGEIFNEHALEIVLGSGVAKELGYSLGDNITLSHGVGRTSFHHHDEHKFTITGILKPTGTPIDQTIHVSVEAIERIHSDHSEDGASGHSPDSHDKEHQEHEDAPHNHGDGLHSDDHTNHDDHHPEHSENHSEHTSDHEGHEHGNAHDAHDTHNGHHHESENSEEHHSDQPHHDNHLEDGPEKTHAAHEEHIHIEPTSITAVFVGLKTPGAVLRFNREVNTYPKEALLSIMPGITLTSLWSVVGSAEKALLGISIFVVLVGLATILISIYTSLNERRREMAILRSIGAGPKHIAFLILFEAAIIALIGSILGIIIIQFLALFIVPAIASTYGLSLTGLQIGQTEGLVLLFVPALSSLMAFWPASKAMQNALSDGLTIRV